MSSSISTSSVGEAGGPKPRIEDFSDPHFDPFATFDRALLMQYLKTSVSYTFEKVTQSKKKNVTAFWLLTQCRLFKSVRRSHTTTSSCFYTLKRAK